jgi:serine/threonine-protein kinase
MRFPEKRGESKISNNGGRFPYWSPKTHELFFRSADGLIMIAPYTVKGDLFLAGKPRIWSAKRLPVNGFGGRDFDLAPDGKQIVALMPSESSEEMTPGHVFFVENFFTELRRRVPIGR